MNPAPPVMSTVSTQPPLIRNRPVGECAPAAAGKTQRCHACIQLGLTSGAFPARRGRECCTHARLTPYPRQDMSSASRERRHPRRRRAFLRLSAARVRTLVEPVLGHEAAGAAVELPARGVNNETYLVRSASSGLAVRVRPRSSAGARTSAQWPLYVRRLFGDVPNGDL